MKLSHFVQYATAEKAPIPAPSPAHVAFVELIGQLLAMGKGNPATAVMAKLVPSVLRDMAEIPEAQLRKWCKEMGVALVYVANAQGDNPEVPNMELAAERAWSEEEEPALERAAIDSTAEPVADQPALPAG